MLIKGNSAELILKYLLENYEGEGNYIEFPYAGYYKEGRQYICFDNTSYCCFVEQTNDEWKAIRWCLQEIDTDELY